MTGDINLFVSVCSRTKTTADFDVLVVIGESEVTVHGLFWFSGRFVIIHNYDQIDEAKVQPT